MSTVLYKDIEGKIRKFNTSQSVCEPLGFLAGEIISNGLDFVGGKVIGGAKRWWWPFGKKYLWVHFKGDSGACYSAKGFKAWGCKKIS